MMNKSIMSDSLEELTPIYSASLSERLLNLIMNFNRDNTDKSYIKGFLDSGIELIGMGANPDIQTTCGNSILHEASFITDDVNIIEALVLYGCNIHCKNMSGAKPIDFACKAGQYQVVQW